MINLGISFKVGQLSTSCHFDNLFTFFQTQVGKVINNVRIFCPNPTNDPQTSKAEISSGEQVKALQMVFPRVYSSNFQVHQKLWTIIDLKRINLNILPSLFVPYLLGSFDRLFIL